MRPEQDPYFQPRPIESSEFLETFSSLIARLDRHIIGVGNSQLGARDDLAAVLRTLIKEDRGNDVIGRFCRTFKHAEPRVYLTTSEAKNRELLLQIAGLPEHDNFAHNTSVPSDLRRTICLAKRVDGKVRRFTWADLIDAYGNTYGSHLGAQIPKFLDEVRLHGIGNADFGSYMLRSLGVAISGICHALVFEQDRTHRPVAHDPFFQGVEVSAVNFTFDGRQHSLEAKARRQNWKAAGPIVSVVDPTGTRFVFGTAEGGYLRLTTIKPTV